MATLAFYVPAPDGTPIQVEVLDVYQPHATVQAISGKPFVGGTLYPVFSEIAVVPTTDIHIVTEKILEVY